MIGFFRLFKEAFNEWLEDRATSLGAALAYYGVFSLAPLGVIAIGLAGRVFGQEAAEGKVLAQLKGTMGESAAGALETLLRSASNPQTSRMAAILGGITLFVGAMGVFIQLQESFNIIWKVKPRPGKTLVTFIRDRLLSFAMVLASGILLLGSLFVTAAIQAAGKVFFAERWDEEFRLWQWTNQGIGFVVITLLFAMLFKFLPQVELRWREVFLGAAVTAVLFTLGKYVIGLYLGRAGITSTYGAAASVVVIMIWVYYSAQILLFGAEFTKVHAMKFGRPIAPAADAVPVTIEERARQGMARG